MDEKKVKNKQVTAVDGLFEWLANEPRLIGSRCKTCGTVSFPKSPVCGNPECKSKSNVEKVFLSRRGKLISFTKVCYPPLPPYIAPVPFVPFAVGEVGFSEGVAILGQMTGCKYEDLKIGMEVETVIDKLYEEKDGTEVIGWKFRPV